MLQNQDRVGMRRVVRIGAEPTQRLSTPFYVYPNDSLPKPLDSNQSGHAGTIVCVKKANG